MTNEELQSAVDGIADVETRFVGFSKVMLERIVEFERCFPEGGLTRREIVEIVEARGNVAIGAEAPLPDGDGPPFFAGWMVYRLRPRSFVIHRISAVSGFVAAILINRCEQGLLRSPTRRSVVATVPLATRELCELLAGLGYSSKLRAGDLVRFRKSKAAVSSAACLPSLAPARAKQ